MGRICAGQLYDKNLEATPCRDVSDAFRPHFRSLPRDVRHIANRQLQLETLSGAANCLPDRVEAARKLALVKLLLGK